MPRIVYMIVRQHIIHKLIHTYYNIKEHINKTNDNANSNKLIN